MKIANVRIGLRLGASFGVVLLLLTGSIGLGLRNMAVINGALLRVTQVNNAKMAAAERMSKAQLTASLAATNIALLEDSVAEAAEDKVLTVARRDYDEGSRLLHETIALPEGKAILARIDQEAATTLPLMDKARRLGLENNVAEAAKVMVGEVAPASAKWQRALQDMLDHQAANNKSSETVAAAAYENARMVMIALGVLAIAFGVAVAWMVARSIITPLLLAVQVAEKVAAGDLRSEFAATSKDETGALLRALETMNGSLISIVGRVRAGTETIATASTQIASGNLDLSSRTERQAGSLEETASSMEELAATVKNNADNVRQADAMAASASEVAMQGGAAVGHVVDTMSAIRESSLKIADIISVIDGIAFQTNILALNAAVEAARAGEQGRGFAVVAAEVRNLAQRSAGAAKEIKELIADSVSKVSAGSALADTAGATMEEVVASVKRVNSMMGDISAAGREQELGIGQVNQAIIEMDGVTQQNAALVEEAAAAAESLRDQAAELANIVSVFKVPGAAPREAAPAKLRLVSGASKPASAPPKRALASASGRKAVKEWDQF